MKKILISIFVIFTFFQPRIDSLHAQTQDVQTVLDRWAEALGGRENLQRMELLHRKSDITYGGMTGTSETWSTKDGNWRNETKLGSIADTVTVFAGEKGWYRDTNAKVRELLGTDLEDSILEAYMSSYSYLFPDRRDGEVSYAGKTDDGKAILMKIKPAGGRELLVYLDASTYLPVRSEQQFVDRKQKVEYSNWKKVDGILLPHEVRIETGREDLYVEKVDDVKMNEPMQARLFEKPAEGAPDHAFLSGKSARNISFELTSNHIYLPVKLNDSRETLWFILDTGASVSVLEAGTVSRLGIQSEGSIPVGGAGEKTVQSSLIAGITFRVPGAEVRNQRAFSIPLDPLFAREGRRIDGILGYDFISRFVVEIDYASRKVHLHDPASYVYSGPGDVVPILLEGSSPYIELKIRTTQNSEPVIAKTLIDTGSRLALTINKPFHTKHDLSNDVKTRLAPMGMGVGGATKDLVGRIASVQIGSIVIPNVITGFSVDEKGAGADRDSDANIGGEILRRFKVIIDYTRNRMIFEKNAALTESFEYDKSGLLFVAEGKDFRTFKITEVLSDSPAAEAGAKPGDTILAVNGKKATDWNYESLRAFFRTRTEPVSLVLQRNQEKIEIQLHPRQMI